MPSNSKKNLKLPHLLLHPLLPPRLLVRRLLRKHPPLPRLFPWRKLRLLRPEIAQRLIQRSRLFLLLETKLPPRSSQRSLNQQMRRLLLQKLRQRTHGSIA